MAAALAVVTGVTLLAGPAGWAGTPGGAASAMRPVSTAENPAALAEAAWHNAVVATVSGSPDRYTGLYRDGEGRLVVTLPAGSDTSATREAVLSIARASALGFGASAAAAAAAAEPVAFRHVGRSSRDLQQVLDRVAAARASSHAFARSVRSWWVDPRTGTAMLGLDHTPSPRETSLLRARFGAALGATVAAEGVATSRSADSAPWYGGDRVTAASNAFCTSGFGVRAGSSSYELTAGHCGSTTWKVGSTTMGVTPIREYFDGGLDTEGISASSVAGRVYTGCLTCSTSLPVKGRWDPVVGDQLCFDGSVTGLVCAATVTSTNRCIFMDSGLTTCHLAIVSKSDGTQVSTKGDSGGPVFFKTSTSVYAAATIVGNYGLKSTGLVEPLSSILPALGVTLVTG